MASRRSRLELIFDILLAIQNKGGKIKPTHLMYKSNLSHKLLNNYLEELIRRGLINTEEEFSKKKQKSNKSVLITEKGLNFLAAYRKEYVKYVEDVEGGKKVNKENKVEIEVLQQRVEVSFVVSRPNLEVSELREKMTLLIYIESAETLISHQDIVRYLNLEAPYF